MTLFLLFILCEQFMGTWGHIKYVNNCTVYETKFKLTFPRRSLTTIWQGDFAWKLARSKWKLVFIEFQERKFATP